MVIIAEAEESTRKEADVCDGAGARLRFCSTLLSIMQVVVVMVCLRKCPSPAPSPGKITITTRLLCFAWLPPDKLREYSPVNADRDRNAQG